MKIHYYALSIVGALVLLTRRAGKIMRASLLGLAKSIYYIYQYFYLLILIKLWV